MTELKPTGGRSGNWVVVGLVALGLFAAIVGLMVRELPSDEGVGPVATQPR